MAKLGGFAGRLLGAPGPGRTWRRSASAAQAASVTGAEGRPKRPEELPGLGPLGSLYWLLARGYLLHTHRLQIISKKLYGPIWKSKFGSYNNINIGSPEVLEQLLRQEGKYPIRSDMALWKEHRDKRDLPYGPFTEVTNIPEEEMFCPLNKGLVCGNGQLKLFMAYRDGERWHRLRQVLNKRMLKPSEAVLYADVINEVVSDLILHLEDVRGKSPSGVMIQDVAQILYRFALEGISYILFETRIGCLKKQIPAETQHFIDAIGDTLKNSVFVTLLPEWTREVLPYWNRYLQGWDTIFAFGKKLIDQKMMMLEKRLDQGEEVSGYLTYLLSTGKLSHKEVYGSIAELLLAGIDTTSNTLSWAMYHLSQDLKIQEALYQEIINVVPKDRIPDAKDLTRMPLLKAIIKETLRLYPVVPANARIIAEKDVVVGGYKFPKDTLFVLAHYALSHDETYFPEPERFLPHRWLREHKESASHPFSSIPFGYGVRACVGRRIAELEMHLALARIIRRFSVKPDPNCKVVKPLSRIVLVPDKPINLNFLDR